MIMTILLSVGFFLIVLALRLTLIRNSLLRGQTPNNVTVNEIRNEGFKVVITGLIVLAVYAILIIFNWSTDTELSVLRITGIAIVLLSLPLLMQWAVYRRGGNEKQLHRASQILRCLGFVLIIAYAIYQTIMVLTR